MKNEDKIVELLAESLKGQDRMEQRLVESLERQDRMEQRLVELQQQNKQDNDRVVGAVNVLTDIAQVWMERTKKPGEHEERPTRLELKAGLR